MAQIMKTNLIIALAIGVLISTAFVIIPSMREGTSDWQLPGMTAAVLFWGAVGSSVVMGVVIAWAVNAVVYGLPAFVALSIFSVLKRLVTR